MPISYTTPVPSTNARRYANLDIFGRAAFTDVLRRTLNYVSRLEFANAVVNITGQCECFAEIINSFDGTNLALGEIVSNIIDSTYSQFGNAGPQDGEFVRTLFFPLQVVANVVQLSADPAVRARLSDCDSLLRGFAQFCRLPANALQTGPSSPVKRVLNRITSQPGDWRNCTIAASDQPSEGAQLRYTQVTTFFALEIASLRHCSADEADAVVKRLLEARKALHERRENSVYKDRWREAQRACEDAILMAIDKRMSLTAEAAESFSVANAAAAIRAGRNPFEALPESAAPLRRLAMLVMRGTAIASGLRTTLSEDQQPSMEDVE
eukprot:TRINITY_DN9823_c0_g1_i1.p1 TRINITY_DN9823_c0_g1~~TRINITY_DN9823_c0_g1_i1.p1  ORF type:complete len:324 (+),score=46.89 TRINITY_DN9823_c0_g1_i1:51-1022(+)